MINESKLDDLVPIKFYQHINYRLLRRDRGNDSGGGGVLVFVKKCLEVAFYHNSLDFEFIYFEIKINRKLYAFESAYRSERYIY